MRQLVAFSGSVRITARTGEDVIHVDVGNGVIVGAGAAKDAEQVSGGEAFERFLAMRDGEFEVVPTRFPQLANLFLPLDRALDAKSEVPFARVNPGRPPSVPCVVMPRGMDKATAAQPSPSIEGEPIAQPIIESWGPTQRRWTTVALAACCGLAFVVGSTTGVAVDRASDAPVRSVSLPAAASSPAAAMSISRAPAATDLVREARQLMRRGEIGHALNVAQEAVMLRPDEPDYQVALGDAYLMNGRSQEAEVAWRTALDQDPSHAVARRRIARHGTRK